MVLPTWLFPVRPVFSVSVPPPCHCLEETDLKVSAMFSMMHLIGLSLEGRLRCCGLVVTAWELTVPGGPVAALPAAQVLGAG